MSSLLQRLPALLIFFRHTLVVLAGVTFIAATADADTRSKGDIVVATVHGDVRVTMAGVTSPLSAGAILQLPATLRTGANGALELRHGPTTIAAAANTELEIPESAAEQGLIERVIQIRGNAFYSVGKRDRTRLRVETPYLVAVIKGTQFNVASQDDSTTIALFEGRLEVRATDESDIVDLHAGEIAIRGRNDPSIRVLRMTATAVDGTPRGRNAAAGAQAADGTANPSVSNELGLASNNNPHQQTDAAPVGGIVGGDFIAASTTRSAAQDTIASASIDAGVSGSAQIDLGSAKAGLQVETGLETANAVSAGTNISVGDAGVDAGLSTSIDLGASSVIADTSVNVDLGAGSMTTDTSAAVDLGAVAAGVSASTGIDLAGGTIDAGVSVGVDSAVAGADLGADVSVGGGSVAVAADAGVDLGAVSAGAAVDAGIDLGSTPAVSVDTGVSAAAGDLATASVDAGVSTTTTDVGASVDVGGTALTVDTTVDVPGGDISAGVDVGGVVDIGVDLGAGTIDLNIGGTDTGGGLLGGLLNRRGKN